MRLLSVVFLSSMLCGDLIALSDEDKGLAIAKDADQKDTGWGDASASMTMILKKKILIKCFNLLNKPTSSPTKTSPT